jgi:hypothetical protein
VSLPVPPEMTIGRPSALLACVALTASLPSPASTYTASTPAVGQTASCWRLLAGA